MAHFSVQWYTREQYRYGRERMANLRMGGSVRTSSCAASRWHRETQGMINLLDLAASRIRRRRWAGAAACPFWSAVCCDGYLTAWQLPSDSSHTSRAFVEYSAAQIRLWPDAGQRLWQRGHTPVAPAPI